jgi:predicted enzyme related to lactoylglutathione lyase
MVLGKKSLITVLPAVDLKRAKDFYTDKIGLTVSKESSEGIILQGAEGKPNLHLYEHGPTKADHTVALLVVDDVEKEVQELKDKGVKFEEYDTPQFKTVNGIATGEDGKVAWFKDTEGNIIAISNIKKI